MNQHLWSLRQATLADLEAILALERACAEAPHWSRSAWLSALASESESTPSRTAFIAYNPRTLLGFAVGSCAAGIAELESVAVHATARRQGIGKALCQQIMSWSRQAGAQTIELEVRASSAGALALYQSLGFVAQGRRPKYYSEPSEDAVLLAAPLEPPTV